MNVFRGRNPRIAVLFVTASVSILLACFALFSISRPASAAPTTMNFQGRLADASGNTVANGTYNMQFRLFTVASGGSATWTETRETSNRVTVTNGLFSVQLGAVTPLSASLFSGNDVYFEITLPTPGTATCGTASCATWESAMTPRHKMATSAYAFNSDTLDGMDSTAFAAATGSANYIQNTSTPQTANFAITGTGRVDTVLQAPSIQRNAAGTLSIGTTATTTGLTLGSTSLTGTLSIDSGAASTVTIGASASARTINIGNVAAVQTVTLGSTNTTSATTIQGGATGSISLATGGTINLNSGTIATNATTANFLNTTATTVNAFGAATTITMGANSGTANIRNSNVSVGNVTTRGTFTNNGATLNSTLALGDLAAGAIGTAAATVNIYSGVTISPTVAGRTYTVPSPTVTTAGRTFYISNINGTNNFIVLGQTIAPSTIATLVWGGSAWTISAGSGANTSLSNIASTNLSAALNTTSGNLTLQTTTSGNIILNPVGTVELQKATNVTGNLGVSGNINLTGATPAIAATTAATNFTINAGTTGQVQIGGVSTGDILFGGGSGLTGCTVTNSSGAFACTSTINGATLSGGSLSGGTITGGTLSATAVNSLNVSGTAISGTGALSIASGGANTNITLNGTGTGQVQVGGTSTGDILLGGGSGSTGCTVTNSSGTFACSSTITGTQLVSTVTTGTAPLTVASTTKVTNLNSDTLDGLDSTAFAAATGSANYIQNTTSPQTADFNITGTGTAGTLQAATFDRASAGALSIGNTNATSINIGTNAAVAQAFTAGSTNTSATSTIQGGASSLSMSNASIALQTGAASANSFTVKNELGNTMINIDTTSNNSNLITNPGADVNTTGWAARTNTTLTQNTNIAHVYYGKGSISAATTANADAGVNYPIQLSPSTAYSIIMTVKATVSGDVILGYAADGATETTYINNKTVGTGWTNLQVDFTTPASVSGSAYIFIKQSVATAKTIYVDGLRASATANSNFYSENAIAIGNSATSVQIGTLPGQAVQPTSSLFVQQTLNNQYGAILQGASGGDLFSRDILSVRDSSSNTILSVNQNIGNHVNITGGSSFWGKAALDVSPSTSTAIAMRITGASSQTGDLLQFRNNAGNVLSNINSNGDLTIGGTSSAASATALKVQNTAGVANFTADTTNGRVVIGTGATGNTTGYVLVLDNKTNAGDPTCTNGGMYYNSSTGQFRFCAGGTWTSMATGVDVQNFTANGTWTKPAGVSAVMVIACGGGGAGANGAAAGGGGAGGGGARITKTMTAAALTGTVTVTVGAAASTNQADGNATSFGNYVVAGGGGGGTTPANGYNGGGGGAERWSSDDEYPGFNTAGFVALAGSILYSGEASGTDGGFGGGSFANVTLNGGWSMNGGSGGGRGSNGSNSPNGDGGGSSDGGTGGGGGGYTNAGGAGGGNAGNAGATGGASGANNGSAGSSGDSTRCGTGGGGGGGGGATGGNGGAGGTAGGGGGGGGRGGTTAGTFGAGGRGEMWVISW